MPGVMGGVGREMLQVDFADICHASSGVDVTIQIRHDQVRMLGEAADVVEVAD